MCRLSDEDLMPESDSIPAKRSPPIAAAPLAEHPGVSIDPTSPLPKAHRLKKAGIGSSSVTRQAVVTGKGAFFLPHKVTGVRHKQQVALGQMLQPALRFA